MLGRTEPRLWTPPLRRLTARTSYGFDVAEFADTVLGMPLDPWERWLVIHAGELLPDGRPRFRKVLVIVARQNGKTHVLVVLSLFWLFVEAVPLVLGTSTNLGYAKESWQKAVDLAESHEELAPLVATVRKAAGEEALVTAERARYRIAAANRRGGRSLTIHRLILDELREHDSWDAWNAAYNAMNAVPTAQAFAITNQGDASAVVLESLRSAAVERVNGVERIRPDGDPQLGLFEWSAPPGSEADDPHALAMSNPNLGRRIDLDSLLADARRAKENGGDELTQFETEILCMRVPNLDPAIDGEAWSAPFPAGCLDPGDLADVRSNVVLTFDVSLDQQHAALIAAARTPDGRVRVEPVAAWTDLAAFRRELPALVRKIKPRKLGWFPTGPAAAVAAELVKRKGWPPPGVELEEIRSDVPVVCMGFAEQVTSRQIAHSGDPLLDAQVEAAERKMRGDAWVFIRRGVGHVDAVYAAAGAVHLARTLPAPVGKPRIVRRRKRGDDDDTQAAA
ncbi:terminase [Amycolatopsis thermoflava]|uniref:terminase n=1 Tax=Amycolatopsis thermoflava TaxID=84480 RepID=UPI003EBECFC2